jgi:ribosome-binding protein aMBF1 (putative translation factor)
VSAETDKLRRSSLSKEAPTAREQAEGASTAKRRMKKYAPTPEGRTKVAVLVNAGIEEHGWTAAELARMAGLTENTVRGVTQATGRYNKSTLVAISAVLGWKHQYLYNVSLGKGDQTASPLEAYLQNLSNGIAAIGELRKDVNGLTKNVDGIKVAVQRIDEKINGIAERESPPGDGPGSD